MLEIKINRLTLENFKCHRYLNLDFGGRSVSIFGDNATGKTSIYDALTWLLFGKDSTGNGEKNIDIKPLDANGDVRDHQAETIVEAELLAGTETVTLRRTYREIWTTRRGSGEPVYEGNTSDYYVDGVPCKKNAFDSRVSELVPEDTFRMLTSVSWFAAGMKWQERRGVLFDMAGTMTDAEIMGKDTEFHPLLESMGKLSVSDYRSKLLSQRKGLTGVRDDAPTRINECQRTLQELLDIDFNEAREQEIALSGKRDELSRELISLEQDAALEKKRLELREAKLERDTLEAKNKAYRDRQKVAGPDIGSLRAEIAAEQGRIKRARVFLEDAQRSINRCEAQIQGSRESYVSVNGEAFTGGICPACGQALPFEKLQEATRAFNEKKDARLAAIIEEANRLKREQQAYRERCDNVEEEIRIREESIQRLEQKLHGAQSTAVEVVDLEEYANGMMDIGGRIEALQGEVSRLSADSAKVRDSLREEMNAVEGQLRFVRGVIAKEAVKEQTERRIADLKEDARNASQALEAIEKMLYLIDEFVRFKARFVEKSVNDLFRIVSFRLFREQANGGFEERCDPVVGGVPYMGLNNGMKINAGIDIINALSRHYGVTVPLFVDNAEAVTRLEDCGCQVIRLVVSEEDKELRMV